VGWALHFERYQACPLCGTGLDIFENGKLVAKGYSPFTAEKYVIRPPFTIPAATEQPAEDARG
jgi:hypothetical protein